MAAHRAIGTALRPFTHCDTMTELTPSASAMAAALPRGASERYVFRSMGTHLSPWLAPCIAPGVLLDVAYGYPIPAMKTVEEIRRERLLWLRDRFGGTVNALADAINKAPSQVSQLLTAAKHSKTGKPRTMGSDLARQIELVLGLQEGLMDTPLKLGQPFSHPDFPTPRPHQVSLADATLTSPEIEWGALMTRELPQTFKVAAPDDAMAPRLRSGQRAEFERGLEPRPGDGVLVADADGAAYIRIYRQGRQGRWEAHTENSAYRTLDSELDGLKVLAVLVSVQARWG